MEFFMQLWIKWWSIIKQFRPCFSRQQTFLWFVVCAIAFSVRQDLVGVTSFIRGLGLEKIYYDRMLDFFHSKAINANSLARTWLGLLLESGLGHKINGRLLILGDGIKAPKEGRKMPAVKSLHQESESNSKPEYIMGHSFQALSLLTTSLGYFFATPLIAQIHEGVVVSNRDQRTLLDKMILMLNSLAMAQPFYLVCDAYYASGKIILPLLKIGQHLITRVRINAVAYLPAELLKRKRGRPKLYGNKIKLRDILADTKKMIHATSTLYDEVESKFLYRSLDLIWRPVGKAVRFVFVVHPTRGSAIFMSTDLSLDPIEIIKIYSLRFKIEVSFKQAMRTLGAYSYHFWMMNMDRIKKCSGDQYLHRKTEKYREQVKRKLHAYHAHVQIGLIAQGVLQVLSMTAHQFVWKYFGSWIRTIRPNILPSETIVMGALRNTLPEFLKDSSADLTIAKFILDKIDLSRAEGQRMVA
jgi:hypothetical protein